MATKSKATFGRDNQVKAVQKLCHKGGVSITKEQVRAAIKNYDAVIAEAMGKGKLVRTNLGTFTSRVVTGRFYNSPPKAHDQKRRWVDAHLKPVCRFSKSLKESLREIEVADPKDVDTSEELKYTEDKKEEDDNLE